MTSKISDESLDKFIEICKSQGTTFKSRKEARECASDMLDFFEMLAAGEGEEAARKERLKHEPKGFLMPSEGRTCMLCGYQPHDDSLWYDKWGMKCMDCQAALNKKTVPGYVFEDYGHKKHITGRSLMNEYGLRKPQLRKLVNEGKLKARIVPGHYGETWVFLRKENPNLAKIIETAANG